MQVSPRGKSGWGCSSEKRAASEGREKEGGEEEERGEGEEESGEGERQALGRWGAAGREMTWKVLQTSPGREPSTLPAVASLHRKRKPRPSLKQNCPPLTRVCSLRRDSTGC